MELAGSWPHLYEFFEAAREFPDLRIWLFGSAFTSDSPKDLDVLIVYESRTDVVKLRAKRPWDHNDPPIHIMAMTAAEEEFYSFVKSTGAWRIL